MQQQVFTQLYEESFLLKHFLSRINLSETIHSLSFEDIKMFLKVRDKELFGSFLHFLLSRPTIESEKRVLEYLVEQDSKGDSYCSLLLGFFYYAGIIVDNDYDKACSLIKKSVNLMNNMAFIY